MPRHPLAVDERPVRRPEVDEEQVPVLVVHEGRVLARQRAVREVQVAAFLLPSHDVARLLRDPVHVHHLVLLPHLQARRLLRRRRPGRHLERHRAVEEG